MASRPNAAVLLALLAALFSFAEGQFSVGLDHDHSIDFSQRIGIPNVPHHPFCPPGRSAICNSIAARLPEVTRLALAEAIIEGTGVKARLARDSFSKLAKNFSGMTQECFKDCSDNFDSLASDMETALQPLKERDPNTAKSNVDASLSETEECNDCFVVDNGYMPPVAARIIKNLKKWTHNAVAIDMTKVLDKN